MDPGQVHRASVRDALCPLFLASLFYRPSCSPVFPRVIVSPAKQMRVFDKDAIDTAQMREEFFAGYFLLVLLIDYGLRCENQH